MRGVGVGGEVQDLGKSSKCDWAWGEPGKENEKVSPNEESSGGRNSQNLQSRAATEECGGRKTGSDVKVYNLPAAQWVPEDNHKHQRDRKNPSWSIFASIGAREGLRHLISS